MRPVLFKIGPIPIRSYGAMVAVGFAVGVWRAARAAKRKGLRPANVLDASLYMLLTGVVGARLVYVLHEWPYYRANPLEIPKIWDSGLTFYGALGAAALAAYVFCRRRSISFLRFADLLSPSVSLGYSFARIGCFLNGCCFGKPSDMPWAVRPNAPAEAGAPPLHPTQLYSSAAGVLIYGILAAADRRRHNDGTVFALYLALYAASRFVIEFFRSQTQNSLGPAFGGVSLSLAQIVSGPLFIAGVAAFALLSKKKARNRRCSDPKSRGAGRTE